MKKTQPSDQFSISSIDFFTQSCNHYHQLLQEGTKALHKFTNKGKAKDVCELGVGLGDLTEVILSSTNVNTYAAIDSSASCLTEAKARLTTFNEIEYIHSDATQFLATKNNTYDLIVSSFLFHNLPIIQKHKLLECISVSLKPEGYLLLVDKVRKDIEFDPAPFGKQIRQFFDYYKKRTSTIKELEFWIEHYINDENKEYCYSEVELSEWLADHSLKIIHQGKRYLLDSYFIVSAA